MANETTIGKLKSFGRKFCHSQIYSVEKKLAWLIIFPWDFRDLYASIELPPSLFVRACATWGECLNYRGGGGGGGGLGRWWEK